MTSNLLESVISLVHEAGKKILEIYETGDFSVEIKSDDSPLTQADRAAHKLLYAALEKLDVGPVLSEEGVIASWDERRTWEQYWLIDPLDGTKEFIKRNGEFTVNVALIRKNVPVLGVVYAPVKELWYYAEQGKGAFRRDAESTVAIAPQPFPSDGHRPVRVVGSRSHTSEYFENFMKQLPNAELVSVGSSLKLCMVAEGSADLYPRLIPTCEWDTAAAQAVAEEAGAVVVDWEERKPLRYNTKEELLNPYFIVAVSADSVGK